MFLGDTDPSSLTQDERNILTIWEKIINNENNANQPNPTFDDIQDVIFFDYTTKQFASKIAFTKAELTTSLDADEQSILDIWLSSTDPEGKSLVKLNDIEGLIKRFKGNADNTAVMLSIYLKLAAILLQRHLESNTIQNFAEFSRVFYNYLQKDLKLL